VKVSTKIALLRVSGDKKIPTKGVASIAAFPRYKTWWMAGLSGKTIETQNLPF
jgi:hypothetical protein